MRPAPYLELCTVVRVYIYYWRTYLPLWWRNTEVFHVINSSKNWTAWITFPPTFGFINFYAYSMSQFKGNCSRKPFWKQMPSQGMSFYNNFFFDHNLPYWSSFAREKHEFFVLLNLSLYRKVGSKYVFNKYQLNEWISTRL